MEETDKRSLDFRAYIVWAIVLGALLWWFGITYFVNKVRTQFNVRGIWILNRVIGSIVMLASVISLVYTILGKTIY